MERRPRSDGPDDRWVFRIGASLIESNVDTRRSVRFDGFADALAAHNRAQTYRFGDLGWNLVMGSAAALEPFMSLTHVSLRANAFAERGGLAALTAGKPHGNQLQHAGPARWQQR